MRYFRKMKRLWPVCFAILLVLMSLCMGCGREEPKVLMDTGGDYEDPAEAFESPEDEKEAADEDRAAADGPKEAGEPAAIWVDICGEVNAPGVYAMEAGDRLYQLVEQAGGFTDAAARSSVNQARLLTDGEQIYVSSREELEAGAKEQLAAAGGNTAGEGKINLNTAGEEELTGLSGIGPAKAAAIVAYRQEHGGFSTIEEITEVAGIGSGTFAKIKDDIVVS